MKSLISERYVGFYPKIPRARFPGPQLFACQSSEGKVHQANMGLLRC